MRIKIIKYINLVFLIILSYCISNIYADKTYWTRVSSPVSKVLYRCIFTDTLNGWAVGDSGSIAHTSNSGVNWVSQSVNINYAIYNIFFLNPRLGWAIANDYSPQGTTILSTTNGGDVWNLSRYPDSTLTINDVHFLDSLNGFLCGYNGLVLRTTNGGANWVQCDVQNNVYKQFPMFKMTFYDSQHGASCGGILDIAGLIWQTTNGGAYWYTSDTLPVPIVNVKYFGSQIIYACGGEFDYGVFVCKSTNSGSSWNNMNLGYIGVAQSVAFRTPNEAWVAMGYSQNWSISNDSGNSWRLFPVPDTAGIFDLVFFDQYRGWAFGQYGAIYKYTPVIGITKTSEIASQFKLFQNYPNPFNPTTKIKFSIPEILLPLAKGETEGVPVGQASTSVSVSLIVYDILGRKIETLIKESLGSGTHEIEFNGSNLSSGVYFYKLEITSNGSTAYVESKKMIILK